MKRICILSDTHGFLRDEVKAALSQCDVIFHAGDIGAKEIVHTLADYGELFAVRGNVDEEDWALPLPLHRFVTIEGLRFLLVHRKQDIPTDLSDTDVVIYGHSHRFEENTSNGILYLNPGSCGRRRFHLELSFCRMTVDGAAYRYEKAVIPKSG